MHYYHYYYSVMPMAQYSGLDSARQFVTIEIEYFFFST